MKWSTIFKYICLALGGVQSVLAILAYFGVQPSNGGSIADDAVAEEVSADVYAVGECAELITEDQGFFDCVRNGDANFWQFISGPMVQSEMFCYRDYSANYWWGGLFACFMTISFIMFMIASIFYLAKEKKQIKDHIYGCIFILLVLMECVYMTRFMGLW